MCVLRLPATVRPLQVTWPAASHVLVLEAASDDGAPARLALLHVAADHDDATVRRHSANILFAR